MDGIQTMHDCTCVQISVPGLVLCDQGLSPSNEWPLSPCLSQVKHALDERKLLLQLQHPFLVRLRGTFQDEASIYLAMEFVAGGEFFSLLRDHGR